MKVVVAGAELELRHTGCHFESAGVVGGMGRDERAFRWTILNLDERMGKRRYVGEGRNLGHLLH